MYDDEFIVYASVNHRLAKLKRVTIADLARERWAVAATNVLTWDRLHQAFEHNGLPPPRIALEATDVSLRREVLASSDLLGFSSRRVLRQAAPRFRFAELRVKELIWTRRVGVSYRKDAYLSPVARRFIEILKVTAKNISEKS